MPDNRILIVDDEWSFAYALRELLTKSGRSIQAGINFTDFTDKEFSDNNYSTQRFSIRIRGKC